MGAEVSTKISGERQSMTVVGFEEREQDGSDHGLGPPTRGANMAASVEVPPAEFNLFLSPGTS
jgi:hypothetical protein